MSIHEVYLQASKSLNMSILEFADAISTNVHKIFPTIQAPKPYYTEFEKEED